MTGKRNPVKVYVSDLKFLGLIDVASNCPFDPDCLDRFSIYADFNAPSKKEEIRQDGAINIFVEGKK